MTTQNDYEKVINYQKQVLEFLETELTKEIEKDKLEERKCHFCDEPADRDGLDEDGNSIEICDNCDTKSKEETLPEDNFDREAEGDLKNDLEEENQ